MRSPHVFFRQRTAEGKVLEPESTLRIAQGVQSVCQEADQATLRESSVVSQSNSRTVKFLAVRNLLVYLRNTAAKAQLLLYDAGGQRHTEVTDSEISFPMPSTQCIQVQSCHC